MGHISLQMNTRGMGGQMSVEFEKNGNRCPLDEYPEAEREEAGKMSFTDAQAEGTAWMASRNKKGREPQAILIN